MLRRADVALRHQVTLADLADRWVGLHGDRLMVTEEGPPPSPLVRGVTADVPPVVRATRVRSVS